MNARPALDTFDIPRSIAAGRIAVGVGLMLAPALTASLYMGREARRPSVRFMSRIFGGRDVALGLALLSALDQGKQDSVSRALWLGVACDSWDAISAIRGRGQLPRVGRWLVAATAIAGAGLGAVAAAGPREG